MGDTDDNDGRRRPITLEEAMEKWASSDEPNAAFAVYDLVAPPLRAYARRHVDTRLVDAVLLETMTRLHENRGTYVKGKLVLPWVIAFANAEIAKQLRAGTSAPPREGGDDTRGAASRERLLRLAAPLRDVWELVELGYEARDVAEILGITPAQVQERAIRAKDELSAHHSEDDETDIDDGSVPTRDVRSHTDLTGVIAGTYTFVREIGRGGMGTVWEANSTAHDRVVAIKVFEPGRDANDLVRFDREYEALARLRGTTNIVEVHERGALPDGQPFYVMERLQGETLAAALRRERRLSWARVRAIVLDLCSALEAVHGLELVHRDLKPGNLFLVRGDDGRESVELLDFGIVKDLQPSGDDDTRPGDLPGTYAYLAPERAKGAPPDKRSDFYSLGIVMFELLAGRRPFANPNGPAMQELASMLDKDRPVPPLSEVWPAGRFTAEIEAIVHRALEREPELRFQSANELADAVRRLDDTGHGELPPWPKPARAKVERARRGWAIGSATVTITTVLATAALKCGTRTPLPSVGAELRREQIDAGLASIGELIDECRRLDEDSPTRPMRVEFAVLGATGEVIEAKTSDGGDAASERGVCLREALWKARFPTFETAKQTIERDL